MTASEIVTQMAEALEARDYQGFTDHFDERGVYELPYALPGRPSRLDGIEAIRKFFSNNMTATNQLFEMQKVEVKIYPGADDNIVFAELMLAGKNIATGEAFKVPSSTAIITCKNGKVISYRDYPNSAVIANAIGMLERYAASLKI